MNSEQMNKLRRGENVKNKITGEIVEIVEITSVAFVTLEGASKSKVITRKDLFLREYSIPQEE